MVAREKLATLRGLLWAGRFGGESPATVAARLALDLLAELFDRIEQIEKRLNDGNSSR